MRPLTHAPRHTRLLLLLGALGAASLVIVALGAPGQLRLLLAGDALILITILTVRSPRATAVIVLACLPFLGLVRRLLIPVAGYPTFDPLLAIGVFSGGVLFLAAVVNRPLADDALSWAIVLLLGLTLVEVFNPFSGGILAGLVALPFLAGPLLWYFAGKAFADTQTIERVLLVVLISASIAAAYGLTQNAFGLTPWDAAWLDVAGYQSLYVYDLQNIGGVVVLRAFSTFSSSGEYAQYVFMGLTIAVVLVAYRRLWSLAFAPLLAIAGFLDSTRGVVVAMLVALAAAMGSRTGSRRGATLTIIGMAVLTIAVVQFFGAAATRAARATNNPLISHEIGGLANPFDSRESTVTAHLASITAALAAIPQNPIGAGPASTSLATAKFGLATRDSEFDITNAFVSEGIVGGLAYLLIVAMTLFRAGSLAMRRRDYVSVATLGLLVLTLGAWLRGAGYAVTPTVWFMVGWVNREFLSGRSTEQVASGSPTLRDNLVGYDPQMGAQAR